MVEISHNQDFLHEKADQSFKRVCSITCSLRQTANEPQMAKTLLSYKL